MNRWLAGAAGLAALICSVHVVGGGATVHAPLLESQTDAELGAYVSVLWHGVTAVLGLMALALGIAAFAPQYRTALGWVGIFIAAAFAVVFIGYGLARLETLWIMPQWTAFLLIGALAAVGLARPGQMAP